MSVIRVLVVSDVCLYREGLAGLLRGVPGLGAITTAASGAEAEAELARNASEVVLVDILLDDALDTSQRLLNRFPEIRLVALGMRDDQDEAIACAESGITAFVSREGGKSELLEVIRCAGAGELVCSRRLAGALVRRVASLAGCSRQPMARLTPRQSEIVRLVDEGLSNKQIASRLHISTATARNHVHGILERLGARNRAEAASVARRSLTRA